MCVLCLCLASVLSVCVSGAGPSPPSAAHRAVSGAVPGEGSSMTRQKKTGTHRGTTTEQSLLSRRAQNHPIKFSITSIQPIRLSITVWHLCQTDLLYQRTHKWLQPYFLSYHFQIWFSIISHISTAFSFSAHKASQFNRQNGGIRDKGVIINFVQF